MGITRDDLEYLKTTIGWIIDNTIVNTENTAYHETFHNSTLNSMDIIEKALEEDGTSESGLNLCGVNVSLPLNAIINPNYDRYGRLDGGLVIENGAVVGHIDPIGEKGVEGESGIGQ